MLVGRMEFPPGSNLLPGIIGSKTEFPSMTSQMAGNREKHSRSCFSKIFGLSVPGYLCKKIGGVDCGLQGPEGSAGKMERDISKGKKAKTQDIKIQLD